MNNKNMKINRLPIWLFPALMLVMVALLAIMPKSQDVRRGAYFAGTSLFLSPDDVGEKIVGEEFPVQLMVQTQNIAGGQTLAKVDFVRTTFCYDPGKIGIEGDTVPDASSFIDLADSAKLSVGGSFTAIISAKLTKPDSTKKCLDMIVKSERAQDRLGSGLVQVATVKFKGLAVGSGTIDLIKDLSRVSGYNPSGNDMAMEISTVTGTKYVITAETPAVAPPVLNYRVAFAGVRPNETECANNWPLTVVVRKGEVTKSYTSTPVSDGTVGNIRAFKGTVNLTGFDYTDGVAVFVKGPKHLQMKYGVNNQKTFYNKSGGEVSLTKDVATSLRYDWTGYPIMACDVVGDAPTTGQNGVCDATDYSVVKTAAVAMRTGENILEDLDGNCKTNAVDLNLLMQTLKERQEQLY